MRNGETHGRALGCLFIEDRVGLVRGIEGTMLGSRMEQRDSGMNAQPLSAITHKRDVRDKKMHLTFKSLEMNAVLAKTQHIEGCEDTKRI